MNYDKFHPLTEEPYISIAWQTGSICNYSCSYCLNELNDGKIKFSDYEPFVKFTGKIKEKYPDKNVLVTMYGGEVTMWKQLKKFLEECELQKVDVRIVTNGYKSIEWWKTVSNLITHLIVSYHSEYASEEHLTELLKLFEKNGNSQLGLMLLPEKFDETIEIGKRISENAKTFVIPKFLRKNFTSELYPYTEEQLNLFKKFSGGFGNKYLKEGKYKHNGILIKKGKEIKKYRNARQIFLEELNRWKGWKCWGGIDSFFVDYGGDIFVGQCRSGKIGNLNDTYELPDIPFICETEVCNCTQDILEMKKEKK